MTEKPHDPSASDSAGTKVKSVRFGDTGEFAAIAASMRRHSGDGDEQNGERLSIDQWVNELRRDPTTAPALLKERREDIDTLKVILRRLIQENTQATVMAAQSLGAVVPEHVDALIACVLDPSLGMFSQAVVDASYMKRCFPEANRALLNAAGQGRRNHDARHVLTISLNTLQSVGAPLADLEAFLATSQELLRYPDLHGRYLLAVLSQSPVQVLPHHDDFVVLWRSLNAQSAGTMSSVRPILTYKLTKGRDDISRSGILGWSVARDTMRVFHLHMPAEDYRSYLTQAFQMLIDANLDLVDDSSLYDTLGSEQNLDVFVEEYCRYLDAYRGKTDLYGSAASIVLALGERSQFSKETQRPAAKIVRHVGNFRAEFNNSVKSIWEPKSPGAAWWKSVYRSTSSGIAGLLGR